jgi:hypothetical protein
MNNIKIFRLFFHFLYEYPSNKQTVNSQQKNVYSYYYYTKIFILLSYIDYILKIGRASLKFIIIIQYY